MKTKKLVSKKRAHKTTHVSHEYAKRKKHHKPFRVRHVSGLVAAFVLCVASAMQIGIYIGKSSQPTGSLGQDGANYRSSLSAVRSSEGFSFGYDRELFTVDATEVSNGAARSLSGSELRDNLAITSLTVRPLVSRVDASDAATRLSLSVLPTQPPAPASNTEFDIELLSESEETISGVKLAKSTYQYSPKFGQIKAKTYSVRWTGEFGSKNIAIHLEGLVEGSEIPALYRSVFDTLSLGSGEVLGLSTDDIQLFPKAYAESQLDDKYLIDSLSPAVVKIYHIVCGVIMVQGQALTKDGCQVSTGSGFFVSTDGYIATNGHVVVFSAKDAFIKFMVDNPQYMVEFLRGYGLSDSQIAQLPDRPDVLAAIIGEVYTLSDDLIKFKNERRTYLVSLGSDPVQFDKPSDVLNADKFKETDSVKKANFVGADYSARDIYVVGSGDESGFSSSDVAILKADFEDSPFIALSSASVTQSQKISIVGFPGDAENALTDNSSLSVSVTDGSISSIRDAAGGRYKLFQSDADASRGNSGGPVLDEAGQVIGLLTYRFKNDAAVDAAKSYIRDVEDLKNLAEDNNLSFSSNGKVQGLWTDGLKLYSENRFSKSVKKFKAVQELYPAHRLASSYIANANKAVDEGRDVKDFPILFVIIGVAGVGGVAVTVVLIARHRTHHHMYKAGIAGQPAVAVSVAGQQSTVQIQQQQPASPAIVNPDVQPQVPEQTQPPGPTASPTI